MALLPVKSEVIPKDQREVGMTGVIVRMKVYRGADAVSEEWVFAPSYTMEQTKGSTFDWYTTSLEKWNLMLHMAGYNPDAFRGKETYKGEKITGFYTLDGDHHSYNAAVNYVDVSFLVEKLEKAANTPNQTAKGVFLLFTENGRYAWYYPTAADVPGKTLQNFAKSNNSYDSLRRAQWLAYLDPAKVASIEFEAVGGGDLTLGNSEFFSIILATSDQPTIANVTAYMKNIQVGPNAGTVVGMVDMTESYRNYVLTIHLKSGNRITVFGGMDDMQIVSSELNRSIYYRITKEQVYAIRDFMSMMPGAKLVTFKPG